jgi:hypothetical protein
MARDAMYIQINVLGILKREGARPRKGYRAGRGLGSTTK